MARIDFHSNVADKLLYACRLARKIMRSSEDQNRTIVFTGEIADLKKLDGLLWSFSKTDFLPHCFASDDTAQETPVILVARSALGDLKALPHADVFVHLSNQMLPNIDSIIARFPRLIEIVSTHEDERLAGRERYKAYQTLGHELHHFDQSKNNPN